MKASTSLPESSAPVNSVSTVVCKDVVFGAAKHPLVNNGQSPCSLMTTKEVYNQYGIHANTLYNYVRKGKLKPYRMGDNGNLKYSEDEVRFLWGVSKKEDINTTKKIAILARVSTPSQKNMLSTQIDNLKAYVLEHYHNEEPLVFSNVVSSFGDRKELYSLIFRIIDKQDISHIVYSYRDRLSRVSCLTNLIRAICKKYNVTLVQTEQLEDNKLLDESYSELIEFVTVLSCRTNGRKSRKTNMVEISEDCFHRMYVLKKSGYSDRYVSEMINKEGYRNSKTNKPYERATLSRRLRAVWTMLESKYGDSKIETSFHRFAHLHLSLTYKKSEKNRPTKLSRKLITSHYHSFCKLNKELPVVAGTITKHLDRMGVEKEIRKDRSVVYNNLYLVR